MSPLADLPSFSAKASDTIAADLMASTAPALPPHPFREGYLPLVAAGFHILAVHPADKFPVEYTGRGWQPKREWNKACEEAPSVASIESIARGYPCNIGVATGSPIDDDHHLVVLDFDAEDPDVLDALLGVVPPSPMVKIGQKGESRFYRGERAIRSRAYESGTIGHLADVLANGKQTVMPGSIHRITRQPYVFPKGSGIVPVADLPELTVADINALEAVCREHGWDGAPLRAPADHGACPVRLDGGETIWRETNQAALANPDAWFGDLPLGKVRKVGNGVWAAVASFRPSSSGKPDHERERNLRLHPDGIKDFVTDQGYTALDLVAAAFVWNIDTALQWLRDKLGLDVEDGKLDHEAILANGLAKAERLRVSAEVQAAADITTKLDSAITWDDREANRAQAVGWLVKKLLPERGVSLMWGQSGAGKSFVALELAACVITGQPFFEHRLKAAGGVLFALGEASGDMPDRLDGLRRGRFDDVAPADPIKGGFLDLGRFPIAWTPVSNLAQPASWRAFADHVRTVAADMERLFGRKLRLVVVDTMVASFGFPEDPDAAAVTKAMKAMDDLAQELGILFLPVHHAGKSKAAGEHGSYAWRGSADTSLMIDADREDITNKVKARRIILYKTRKGSNEGWNQGFDLKEIELRRDEDGDAVTAAIVVPKAPGEGANDNEPAITLRTPGINRFLKAAEPVREHATFRAALENGEEVDAIYVANVRAQYVADNPGKKDGSLRQAFRRGLEEAKAIGLIKVQGQGEQEIVWFLENNEAAA